MEVSERLGNSDVPKNSSLLLHYKIHASARSSLEERPQMILTVSIKVPNTALLKVPSPDATGYFPLHTTLSCYQVCIWNTSIFCIKENRAILLLPIPLTGDPREFLGFTVQFSGKGVRAGHRLF